MARPRPTTSDAPIQKRERKASTKPDAPPAPPAAVGEWDAQQLNLRLERTSTLLPDVPEKRVLRKAVQAVHCYPTSGEHSVYTRRAFNALVVHAQDVFSRLSEEDREAIKKHRGTPQFTLTRHRMCKLTGEKHGDRLEAALRKIFEWEMTWNVLDDTYEAGPNGPLVGRFTTRVISSYGIGQGEHQDEFTYEFPHDMLLMLLEPRPYAQIEMRVSNELGSQYAIGLYENCVRYFGTRNKITASLPTDEWVSLIAGVGKYKGAYKDFKRYALEPAIKLLAALELCPFTVEPIEIKGPRGRVMALQFKLIPKQQAQLPMALPPTWDPRLVDALTKVYGMAPAKIAELARTATEAELQEAMARDRMMMMRKIERGEVVADRAAYLFGILRNIQAGRPRDADPEEEVDPAAQAEQEAAVRLQDLRQQFEAERMAILTDRLETLPADELEELRAAFLESHKDSPMARITSKPNSWSKRDSPAQSMFRNWLVANRPELIEQLLRHPRERDFNVWLLMRQTAATGAGGPDRRG